MRLAQACLGNVGETPQYPLELPPAHKRAGWFGSSVGQTARPASVGGVVRGCVRGAGGLCKGCVRFGSARQTQKVDGVDQRMGLGENPSRRPKSRSSGRHTHELVHGRAFFRTRAHVRRSASIVVGSFFVPYMQAMKHALRGQSRSRKVGSWTTS